MADEPVKFFQQHIMRVFDMIRLKKKEIVAIYFFAIVYGLVQLSIPLGIQAIINFIQAYTFSTSLWILIFLVVLGVAISGSLQITQLKIIERVNQKIFARFGLQFAYHLPRLDLKEVDQYYLPELVNRFFDTITLQKGLTKLLLDLPTASIQIIFGLILLSLYNTVFIIFGLLLLVVLVLIIYFTSAKGVKTSLLESNIKYKVAGWLEELARVNKTFKFSRGTPIHLQKTDKLVAKYLDARTDHFKVLLVQYWALIVFKVLITAGMLIVGAVLAINNQINIGQFVAAEIVILMIMASVERFIYSFDDVYDVITGVNKLNKVLEKPLEKDGTIALPAISNGINIRATNVSFGFDEQIQVLQNVSFYLPAGATVCIMGNEGAGKSTLLRLLTGSFNQFKGSLTFDDIPINNYKLESLRSQTGIVLSDQDIFEGSLMDNITMASSHVDLGYLTDLTHMLALNEYVASLPDGLQTYLEATGKRLSKSNIQKILLLRSLVHKPRLLLLEEPWSALTPDVKQSVQQFLLTQKQTTIVVATNDIMFAKSCNYIIEMTNGRVNRQGMPAQLFNT